MQISRPLPQAAGADLIIKVTVSAVSALLFTHQFDLIGTPI